MPAPGIAVTCSPGIAFSHMPLRAPPRGTQTPPWGPVMKVTCCAATGVASAAQAAAIALNANRFMDSSSSMDRRRGAGQARSILGERARDRQASQCHEASIAAPERTMAPIGRICTMRIVGILLAAGHGSRIGGDQLLAPLDDGTPVGVQAARNLIAALEESVAVVRPEDVRLAQLLSAAG